jgi:predicted transcriptional regulator of viral defense system
MELIKALTLSLGDLDDPVVTAYRIGNILHDLYRDKKFRGEPLARIQKEFAEGKDYYKYVDKLNDEGILAPYKGLPNTVFTLLGRKHESEAEIACVVDPFCYLSHLSAMSYHGLTNRIPSKIFISSPSPAKWREFSEIKMRKELQDDYELYINSGLPKLARTKLSKIGRKEVNVFNSIHLGAFKKVRASALRVSTIGRTFLDMLRSPELCGGINHVLEVYEEFAHQYLRLIVDEIETNGKSIDKVRAGYILDERLNIKDERVSAWTNFAQRGGSRKLDASEEYIPQWSDKWCISINIFENK